MMIRHLLNKTVVISRLQTTSGRKMAFSTVTSDLGHIQPLANDDGELGNGKFSKNFIIYLEGTADVSEGDIIKDIDTNVSYRVKSDGVTRRTFGSFDYLIVSIEKL